MNIIITAPSLNTNLNVSGISSVVEFIIERNEAHHYIHFQIGKSDLEKGIKNRVFRILRNYFKWIYLLITTKNKLVHYNFPLDTKAILRDCPLILFTRLLGVKLIIHIHGGDFIEGDDIPNWAKLFLKITFNGKHPLLVLGETEKENLINRFGCKNVFVLPNSINFDDAKSFSRDQATNNQLNFLFLGRIIKLKGLEYIYLAFKELKEKHQIDFKFYLAGKGKDEKEYIHKFRQILGEDFIYKGVVSGQQKLDLLKETNVFLLPSFVEGLPIALLEAMAYAQLPICTNVGSIKHVIENNINGYIVGVKSKDDIVKKILTLQNDISKIKVLGLKARETMFEKYDPQVYIHNLNRYYNYE